MTATNYPSGKEINIYHAQAISAGYGHKKITVELEYNGEYQKFIATTSNMPDYDEATELDGEEKYMALYRLIENNIQFQIFDWIDDKASN